jgi:hypothetical protein
MVKSYLYKIGQTGKVLTNSEFVDAVGKLCEKHKDQAVRNYKPKTVQKAIETVKFYSDKGVYCRLSTQAEWHKI